MKTIIYTASYWVGDKHIKTFDLPVEVSESEVCCRDARDGCPTYLQEQDFMNKLWSCRRKAIRMAGMMVDLYKEGARIYLDGVVMPTYAMPKRVEANGQTTMNV